MAIAIMIAFWEIFHLLWNLLPPSVTRSVRSPMKALQSSFSLKAWCNPRAD